MKPVVTPIRLAFLALLVAAGSAKLGGESAAVPRLPKPVSLVELLASPSTFEGQRVRVYGVYVYDVDCERLFLTKDHAVAWDEASSIVISRMNLKATIDKSLTGQMTAVEGTFVYNAELGVRGIKEITSLYSLEPHKPTKAR